MDIFALWDKTNVIMDKTILHPQYFVQKYQAKVEKLTLAKIYGKVLDVGCGKQLLKKSILSRGHKYIGLDHPQFYKKQRVEEKPDILADITKIPLPNSSCDSVILFMVLDDLPQPLDGLKEIHRVLKKRGQIFISVMENYPAHDLPHDYSRFRISGIIALCRETGFKIVRGYSFGNFWEVNSLNFNVFLMQSAKFFLDKTGNIFLTIILITLFYPLILSSNLLAIALGPLDFIKTSRLINFVIAKKI